MPWQRFHHRDTRHHRIAAVLADKHQALYRGFPMWQFALGFGQLDDVSRDAAERDQRLPTRQYDRIEKVVPTPPAYASRKAS